MVIKKDIDITAKPTAEQLKMLEEANKKPITFDEDSPELTEQELAMFRRISEERKAERRKQTVTIRLSPQALQKAKSLGKGYTSILSRILESALNDAEVIKQFL